MNPSDLNRRILLRSAALGVVVLPVLAACGDASDAASDPGPTTSDPSTTPTVSADPGTTEAPSSGGEVLASTSDIEVGGAVFLAGIVITQPEAGEFHAFDRECTHRQCPVTDLRDGKIHCSCHDSLYDLTTGDNVGGPAPAPLTKVDIRVEGDQILKA